MTSNHPDKLDKALTRPGRIDLSIEFTKCSLKTIKKMFYNFYGVKIECDENILSNYFTPAKVSQILLENINNPKKALENLSCYN